MSAETSGSEVPGNGADRQENTELVRELVAAVGRQDVEAAVALCGSELEFVDVLAPLQGTLREVRGEAGVREWFAGFAQPGKGVTAEVSDLEDLGGGRVIGSVEVTQEAGGFSECVYGIWEIRDAKFVRICSFLDRDLARIEAGIAGVGPLVSRRWVEGTVSAKLLDKQSVVLTTPEHDHREFSVRSSAWPHIEVGQLGIVEVDSGEVLSWRPLSGIEPFPERYEGSSRKEIAESLTQTVTPEPTAGPLQATDTPKPQS